jgi:uncharacterized PurR-regulated membrane protein YhhQ (DUF165 family)
MKYIALLAYLLTIPAANWMIGNLGTECIPQGPCLIPVGFGLMAPSGVLLIGVALLLRDAVHQQLGVLAAIIAIFLGSVLSAFFAPPALVMASAVAFLLGEMADLLVYAPLRRRNLSLAVLASGAVGAVVDSAVFLWLAFGSLAFIEGQVVGKMWMAIAVAVILQLKKWRAA